MIDENEREILLRSRIKLLQQENQQLKEKITLLQASEPMLELTKYYSERDKYKSVLDEIRERILEMMSRGRGSFLELLEILDKVKE